MGEQRTVGRNIARNRRHQRKADAALDDLDRLVERFGPGIEAHTSWGTRALSLPALVGLAVEDAGASLLDRSSCTRCGTDRWFSHRRGERGRQVMTVVKMGAA